VQDSLRAGSWFFTFGTRVDHWVNRDGFSMRSPVNGPASLSDFPDRSETALSPRFSISHSFESGLSVGGSVYQAFRAPTLNELYRGFRVGNVVTSANADLRAERLTGGEVGMGLRKFSERLTFRTNLFWSDIKDPVANVTVTTSPFLITRQRQNLGSIRAQGLELSGTLKLMSQWEVSSEYLLTSSKVLRFPANRGLEGLWVPQVPRNEVNFQVSYYDKRWTAGVQGRFIGRQFDDDQNLLALRKFLTMDAEVSRTLSPNIKVFVAAQNLTGVRYEISKTPVTTVGPPFLVRVGTRFTFR
jgi:outer membrane receptor protein involved in Fe transport